MPVKRLSITVAFSRARWCWPTIQGSRSTFCRAPQEFAPPALPQTPGSAKPTPQTLTTIFFCYSSSPGLPTRNVARATDVRWPLLRMGYPSSSPRARPRGASSPLRWAAVVSDTIRCFMCLLSNAPWRRLTIKPGGPTAIVDKPFAPYWKSWSETLTVLRPRTNNRELGQIQFQPLLRHRKNSNEHNGSRPSGQSGARVLGLHRRQEDRDGRHWHHFVHFRDRAPAGQSPGI